MQLLLRFRKEQIKLPIATGETVQGLIYKALCEDGAYSAAVHNKVGGVNGRIFKLFNFSELRGRYTVEGKNIIYYSAAELEVRSVDDYLMQLLFLYFSKNKRVRLGNNDVEVESVHLVNKAVFSNRAVIKTASPITVYITEADKHTKYYSPYDAEFYDMIRANAKRKWESFFGDSTGFDFCISPLDEADGYIKRATRFKSTFITAWHGKFLIEGTPEVLNFLYNVGIGSKNSQGFGMFNLSD